jgi:hypothetical protein
LLFGAKHLTIAFFELFSSRYPSSFFWHIEAPAAHIPGPATKAPAIGDVRRAPTASQGDHEAELFQAHFSTDWHSPELQNGRGTNGLVAFTN